MHLERAVLRGLTWASGARLLQQAGQFGAIVVLARLLSPEHFGIVAIAAAAVAFLALLAEFGFGAALVQRPVLNEDHLSTAFWAALLSGALLATIAFAAAPMLAAFMGEPVLVPVTRVLSGSLLLTTTGIVPRAVLQRRMAFGVLARIDAGSVLVSAAVAVLLAILGAGLWSIVAQMLAASLVLNAGYTLSAGWRPGRRFSLRALREVANVGVGVAGFNVVNFGARNFDDLIIGRFLGTYALGLYGRAYMLMLLPIAQVSSAVGGVLLPALAAARERPQEARFLYLSVLGLAALMALPVLVGTLVVADSLVPVLFGAHWAALVPVLRILCLVGCLQIILAPTGAIYQAFGATRLLFAWGVVASGVMVASFLAGAWYGSIEAVAWCYLLGTLLLLYPGLAVPGRLIGLRAGSMLAPVLRPAAAALGMALAAASVGLLLDHRLSALPMLAVQTASGILAYAALVRILCPEPVRRLRAVWRAAPADAAVPPFDARHAVADFATRSTVSAARVS
jgi:O-antigen/teichoic acid export membrane protein